jgi:hypothetical protein
MGEQFGVKDEVLSAEEIFIVASAGPIKEVAANKGLHVSEWQGCPKDP